MHNLPVDTRKVSEVGKAKFLQQLRGKPIWKKLRLLQAFYTRTLLKNKVDKGVHLFF